MPSACNSVMTPVQPEASANAPSTRRTVGAEEAGVASVMGVPSWALETDERASAAAAATAAPAPAARPRAVRREKRPPRVTGLRSSRDRVIEVPHLHACCYPKHSTDERRVPCRHRGGGNGVDQKRSRLPWCAHHRAPDVTPRSRPPTSALSVLGTVIKMRHGSPQHTRQTAWFFGGSVRGKPVTITGIVNKSLREPVADREHARVNTGLDAQFAEQ